MATHDIADQSLDHSSLLVSMLVNTQSMSKDFDSLEGERAEKYTFSITCYNID